MDFFGSMDLWFYAYIHWAIRTRKFLSVWASQRKYKFKVNGVYRFSRNPMYLGIYATVLASGLYTLNPILFLLAIFEITNEPKGFTIGR